MTETVETRIKLPGEIHRAVKAEAARHGITLAEALGMCVSYIAYLVRPLQWRDDPTGAVDSIRDVLNGSKPGLY